jgi:small-conductance mechanosensitive channel
MNIGIILIIFCLLSFSVWIIISETKSLNNKNIANDENDEFAKSKRKIRSIDSLFYGIVLLIITVFLIYNQI